MASILADAIFKCIFLNKNDKIRIPISLKLVPRSPIGNKTSIGSDNGLAPKRRQAITWTSDDPIHWRIYAALGGDESYEIHQYTASESINHRNVKRSKYVHRDY